jgi:hypothetical protein
MYGDLKTREWLENTVDYRHYRARKDIGGLVHHPEQARRIKIAWASRDTRRPLPTSRGEGPSVCHHWAIEEEATMIVLGIILALIGWLTGLAILVTIGVILIIVGVVLWLVPIGGRTRRYYWDTPELEKENRDRHWHRPPRAACPRGRGDLGDHHRGAGLGSHCGHQGRIDTRKGDHADPDFDQGQEIATSELVAAFAKNGNAFQGYVNKLNELNQRRMLEMGEAVDASVAQMSYLREVVDQYRPVTEGVQPSVLEMQRRGEA